LGTVSKSYTALDATIKLLIFYPDHHHLSFFAESSPIPNILTNLYNYYALEEGIKEVQQLISSPTSAYHLQRGLLYHRQRLYLPAMGALRSTMLNEFHATPSAGHSGLKATMARLATSFYWPGM